MFRRKQKPQKRWVVISLISNVVNRVAHRKQRKQIRRK